MKENNRFFILILFCLGLIAIFVIRLFFLQVIKYDFFTAKSQSQIKKIIKIHSHRGWIYDRKGKPLAVSKRAYSVYAVPPKIEDKAAFAKTIAPLVGVSPQKLLASIDTTVPFVWVKRKASPELVETLRALKLDSINFIREEKRFYPNGSLACDILGFVGIDGGLGGIEYKYDSALTGSPGKLVIEGDPRGGRLITSQSNLSGIPTGYKEGVRRFEPASFDGGHVHTTIDEYLQFVAEQSLKEAVDSSGAKKGQVVVMDPKTGDVLAMADYPVFDPNAFYNSRSEILKNSTIVDVFEPGSVFKVFTVAAAIEEGVVSPETIYTVPETLRLANRTIKEAHRRKEGETDQKSVTNIIEESLNVGTTMIAMDLGAERFYKYMKKFGFGARGGIELPGESAGLLRSPKDWSAVDIGMISFGQGVSVTTLQLATAMSAIANGGALVKPRILKYTSDHENVSMRAVPTTTIRRVVSPETASSVLEMMEAVVERGTGIIAKMPEYRVGAKTGTAQIAGEGGVGYLKGEYVASFMGAFPVSDPKLVIVVNIHSPKTKIWGSSIAGPVFKTIAKRAIDYLNITPDKHSKES